MEVLAGRRLRRTNVVAALCVLAVLLAACGSGDDPPTASPDAASGEAAQPDTGGDADPDAGGDADDDPDDPGGTGSDGADLKRDWVVAYSAIPQLAYSASRTAWRQLNNDGWQIEELFVPQNELAIQALVQGEVDLVPTATLTGITAINQGEDIVGIVAIARGEWVLVGRDGIESPDDLRGATIAVHSETSVSNLVVQHTLQEHGIDDATVVMIPGSPARAEALTQGQVDATSLFISDALALEAEADTPINIVSDYADLPFIDQMLFVRRNFVDEYPEEARAIVRGLLDTHQRFQDEPAWGVLQANLLLPETPMSLVERVVEVHNEINVWSPTGGIRDYDDVAETIAFLKAADILDANADDDPRRYVDLSVLEDVR